MRRWLTAVILTSVLATSAHAADIRPALVNTFGHEGGFQRMKGDSGNYANGVLVGTKYGISAASYPHEDIPNLTIERAAQIYQRDFWGASRCDDWKSQSVAETYFEVAVNAGQGSAARLIQKAANIAAWPKAPITVDGNIGPATVRQINEVDQKDLYFHFMGLAYGHYQRLVIARPEKRPYVRNWSHRAAKNIIQVVIKHEARKR